jgi:hypothetical protein
MKKKPPKNPAAVALARRRWKAVPPEARSAEMTRVVKARWAKRGGQS